MAPQLTIGRYEVIEELGHGAMGTVYRAKDPAMDRVVALKTIRSEILGSQMGQEFRDRFYREARAAGALAHPGIVPVFDVGEHDGTPFLVMEFVNGRTLADAASTGERLRIERVCEIAQQVAEALGYAHQKGVVHRDIKAANILLTSRETYGIERPKITDFGVAKLASAHMTTTGQVLGTPVFMPPEQFSGGAIDGRTDIYALGVMLYWLVTGEYPFPGESVVSVSYKVMHTDPIPPRRLNPAVPEALDRIILRCLAKNPAERYQSGDELARELATLRAGAATTNTRSTVPVADSSDPLATLDPRTTATEIARLSGAPVVQPISQTPLPTHVPVTATAPVNRKTNLVLAGAIAALAIAVGGLYLRRERQPPANAATPTPAATTNVATAPVASAPPGTRTSSSAASPTPTGSAPAPGSPAPNAAASSALSTPPPPTAPASSGAKQLVSTAKPSTTATPPAKPTRARGAAPGEVPTVDFDPLGLNPNENARLRVDMGRIPPNLELMLVMDGKLYQRRTAAEFKQRDGDMYLPAGVHEFRVRARSGSLLKISNIVSADFEVKKRKTLRVELRLPPGMRGSGASVAEMADEATVFVSLK